MQGTIAQTLALVIHGNTLLRGRDAGSFFPLNPTCKFCKRVAFVTLEPAGVEAPFAATPDDWFARLKAGRVDRYPVDRFLVEYSSSNQPGISDRDSVAFVGGGGHWRIAALTGATGSRWEGRWQVGDRNDPEKKIWNVVYGEVARALPATIPLSSDLEAFRAEMLAVLLEAGTFAKKQNLKYFADCFDRAASCLGTDRPLPSGYRSDLAPEGVLPVASERLLAAADLAWVFGGMGSWNDLGFKGATQEQYKSLSDRLYLLLNRAFVTAANASAF